MGRLTTHVLDTMHGSPASGMHVTLFRIEPQAGAASVLLKFVLNADGRADAPLLEGEHFKTGRYRLVFEVETYFRTRGVSLPDPAFLGDVPIDFGLADASAHYHVPLLVSPWAFSTYRGS